MNNYKYLIIFVKKLKVLKQTPFSINYYDDVTQLVSKGVFIIEEQLCKSVWQLVKG